MSIDTIPYFYETSTICNPVEVLFGFHPHLTDCHISNPADDVVVFLRRENKVEFEGDKTLPAQFLTLDESGKWKLIKYLRNTKIKLCIENNNSICISLYFNITFLEIMKSPLKINFFKKY